MSPADATIPCPNCQKQFAVPFSAIGPGKKATCPNCGKVLNFSGQDLGKVQEAIDQLAAQYGGAKVKVTVKTRSRRPWWKFWGA